ncbi:energy transducer TonB [Pedobacter sp. LMG 31643]|nr:energy transducer TonB [Pedobacter foliorum]
MLLALSFNLYAQDSAKPFVEADSTIIDLNRPFYGNVKIPKFPGQEYGIQGYIMNQFHFTQKEINNGAKGEVNIWIYIERDGTISQTRFEKNTNPDFGERVRNLLLHAPKYTPGTKDGKPARFKVKLVQKFESKRAN